MCFPETLRRCMTRIYLNKVFYMADNDNSTRTNKTQSLALSGLCIAMTAVCSWISIPVPGTSVPINLATFAVILSGLILGRKYGAISMAVFLLLGSIGVPVFHGFTGGFAIVAGPTGGFLFGYIALAMITGNYAGNSKTGYIVAVLFGELVLYVFGTLWFVFVSGSGLSVASLTAAVAACVLPFLPGDAVKAILAYLVYNRLKRTLPKKLEETEDFKKYK